MSTVSVSFLQSKNVRDENDRECSEVVVISNIEDTLELVENSDQLLAAWASTKLNVFWVISELDRSLNHWSKRETMQRVGIHVVNLSKHLKSNEVLQTMHNIVASRKHKNIHTFREDTTEEHHKCDKERPFNSCKSLGMIIQIFQHLKSLFDFTHNLHMKQCASKELC